MGALFTRMGKRFSSRWDDDDAQTSLTDGVSPESEAEWQCAVLKVLAQNPPVNPSENVWHFTNRLQAAIALCPGLVRVVGQDQALKREELYPVALLAVKWFEAHRTPYVLERRGSVLVQVDATPCPSGQAPSETSTAV